MENESPCVWGLRGTLILIVSLSKNKSLDTTFGFSIPSFQSLGHFFVMNQKTRMNKEKKSNIYMSEAINSIWALMTFSFSDIIPRLCYILWKREFPDLTKVDKQQTSPERNDMICR